VSAVTEEIGIADLGTVDRALVTLELHAAREVGRCHVDGLRPVDDARLQPGAQPREISLLLDRDSLAAARAALALEAGAERRVTGIDTGIENRDAYAGPVIGNPRLDLRRAACASGLLQITRGAIRDAIRNNGVHFAKTRHLRYRAPRQHRKNRRD